jgi:P pilus assembly chaperone PapD
MEFKMLSRATVLLSLFILFLLPSVSFARVDIIPHKVVIENRERSGEIIVLNLSQDLNNYDLNVIHYRQDENGAYETLEEPLSPLFDPREILRMSPQSFQLAGSGRQKVRLSLRKPADLPEGEYRFHIVARGYEAMEEKQVEENKGVFMDINVGIAIPVIVRHGDLSATSSIGDFELVGPTRSGTGKPELKFTAFREGNASTLGRVDVSWAEDGRNFEDIGFITNFNIFTEIDRRFGAVPLDKLPRGGTVRVLYTDTITEEVYDEVVFDL